MIAVQNLGKRQGGRAVLSGVDLSIAEGETVAVVGPSGGGKTTLLRCLNGLEPFDEGRIRIAGFELVPGRSIAARELARLRTSVGIVFQELHLFPHLTLLDNVTLGPRVVRREPPARAAERGRDLLARVGLGDRLSAFPHELSGGQKQRVAIARALAQEPSVLLLDEPTSALDPRTASGVAETITELTRGRVTVVLVTHHLELARTMADRVVSLAQGRISDAE